MIPVVRYLRDPAGHRVAYTVHGEGPYLVCPAWWISHVEKDWTYPGLRQFLERLGECFRVVRYDRPGVGLSDRDVPPRTLAAEVELLSAIIDSVVEAEKTSVFAVSCGSPVALTYAARHPHRLERICCYGAYLNGADIATESVRQAMVQLVLAHWGLGSQALADVFLPDQTREELDALSRQQREACSATKAAELLELTYAMDATTSIDGIAMPDLLVVHRSDDRAIPCVAGQRLAAAIPGTPFITLPGRAHPPWFERDDVLELAIAFLLHGAVARVDDLPIHPGDAPCVLDAANCELIVGEKTKPLTPLEYGVIRYLIDAADRVVTRDELLEHVWRSPLAGSNKVEAVIRTLRKKLDDYAQSIETVRGHGYRFRRWRRAER